ncbi:right-handed parallel beta-helix repeat-containing protein [Xanthobacter autotrophicus]|uniref:right-handed parallel beta-helix repeat-containing protein n=1 Tax=Xanthobacter autotrophicus TaxID=280 RepID=UPI0037271126
MSVHDTALRVGASAVINLGIARSDIPSRVIPFRSITLAGFSAPGDLGSGAIYVRGTSSGPMAIQDAAGTWWNLSTSGRISLGWFGAKGDGVTNDYAAIQAWLTFIGTNGFIGYIPKGRFRKTNTTTPFQLTGDIKIFGDDHRTSVLLFDDDAQGTRQDMFAGSPLIGDLLLYGIGFEGTWGGSGDYSQRSQLAVFNPTGDARIVNCRFYKSRYMSCVISGASSVYASGNVLEEGVADGIRLIGCKNIVVVGNRIRAINDDAIAIHSLDSDAAPSKSGIVVSANYLVDSQGITVLGGKSVNISDNVLVRPHTRAIFVGRDTSEGNTALVGVSITGNQIFDLFNGYTFSTHTGGTRYWISVAPLATTPDSDGKYIFEPNGGGGIKQPWSFLHTNDTDAAGGVIVGAVWLNISDNVCARTLTTTSAYSNYGYGPRLGRSGPVDPAITATDIGGVQIYTTGTLRNTVIADNVLWGGDYAIQMNGSAANTYLAYVNVLLSGNQIGNFVTAGVRATGRGTMMLSANLFDGDPLHVAAGRLANGKWTSGSAHRAIWLDTTKLVCKGAVFRNVYTPYLGTGISSEEWTDNTLACNPTDVGFNADNIGIGDIGRPNIIGTLLVEDGDPASATYGQVLNACVKAATSIPTTGKYARGHFVWNLTPSVSAGKVLLGWSRLTTGSAHVSGTDWSPVYGTTT